MRDSFVESLIDIAKKDFNIVLLTADLGFGVFEKFEEKYKDQYFNVGVAEQNMTGVAVGMALEGKKVFTYSTANFPTLRCLEQIRNDACYHNANITIISSGGGFSYGPLGMSHHATEDLSILRSLPNTTITTPCTELDVKMLTKELSKISNVCYLRLDKSYCKEAQSNFTFGKAYRFRDGKDFTLAACGGVLEEAILAADLLKKDSINVRVSGFHSIKPLDKKEIFDSSENTGGLITIEENNILGGFGSAVSEVCMIEGKIPRKFQMMGLNDEFSSIVGSQKYLRKHYKLDAASIVKKVKSLLN